MLASTRKQLESFVRCKKQKLASLTKQKVTLFCTLFPNIKIMETKTKTIFIDPVKNCVSFFQIIKKKKTFAHIIN